MKTQNTAQDGVSVNGDSAIERQRKLAEFAAVELVEKRDLVDGNQKAIQELLGLFELINLWAKTQVKDSSESAPPTDHTAH